MEASNGVNGHDKESDCSPRARLARLFEEVGNRVCADCIEPEPTWASTNWGTFICTQCAGVHRYGRVADDSKVVKLPYYATANVQIIEIGNLLCS